MAQFQISQQVRAAYAVRVRLTDLLNGIPISIWYDWNDDGADPQNLEDHFGIVSQQLRPKPAYRAITILNQELSEYTFVERLKGHDPSAYLLLFRKGANDYKLAVWSTGILQRIILKLSEVPITPPLGCHIEGTPFSPHCNKNRLTLHLRDSPDYISLGNCRPENLPETAVTK